MKDEPVPELLPNETDTEDILRKKLWNKRIKKIPKEMKELGINKKLISWGKNKKSDDEIFGKTPSS